MKVLSFRTFWYPNNGPGTRRIEPIVRGLAERGHLVTFLALKPGQDKPASNVTSCQTVLVDHSINVRSLPRRIELRAGRLLPRADFYSEGVSLIEHTARRLIEVTQPDVVVTTYQPMASLYVADRLHRRYGIPWVADLRDLPDQFDEERRSYFVRRNALALRKYCMSAKHLITVSPPLKEALKTRYDMPQDIEVVYNGYEGEINLSLLPRQNDYFDIGYFGSVYLGRSVELIIQGLEILSGRGFNLEGVRFRIFGRVPRESIDFRSSSLIAHLVSIEGMLPHPQAIDMMRRCGILISLASPNSRGILTSKIFEYAMIGRPVLSVPKDNDSLDTFIDSARIGLATNSANEVASFLEKHITNWRFRGCLPVNRPNIEYVKQFSRTKQSDRFCEVLENLI